MPVREIIAAICIIIGLFVFLCATFGVFRLKYAVVLVWEIFKANVDVIKIILSPKMEIEPAIVTFHTDLESDAAQVMLANSITLTPGTYTANLENGDYVICALDRSKFGEGLNDSVFAEQLRRLEGKK